MTPKKWITYSLTSLIFLGICLLYIVYATFYQVNISYEYAHDPNNRLLYIKKNDSLESIIKQLKEKNILLNEATFKLLAHIKSLPMSIQAGKYRLKKEMSSNELINMIMYGLEEKVNFSLAHHYNIDEVCAHIDAYTEANNQELKNWLSPEKLKSLGLKKEEAIAFFISKRYQISWATNSQEFMEMAEKEFYNFWNTERRKKAQELKFSIGEVNTLASIVEAEQTILVDERPKIAGLYINRLKKNIRLQSDPTVRFARNDKEGRRVYSKHLRYDSPYNTYVYKGLPPGPINLPSQNAIDAVLNYEKHNYLYMAAKHDFSGAHLFAKDFETHKKNANLYRRALNLRNIKQ